MVNNISNNQIQEAGEILQTYWSIDACLVVAALLLFFVFAIIIVLKFGPAERKCSGCRKLAQCERDIKHIKEVLLLNKYVEPSALKDIISKVEEIRKRIIK